MLRELAQTWRHAASPSAATVVLVAPEPHDTDERDWIYYDMGQATIQMMVVAPTSARGCHSSTMHRRAGSWAPQDRFCVALVRSATRATAC